MTDIRPELIKHESDMHHFDCLPCCRHERVTDGGPEFPGRGFSLVVAKVLSFLRRILSENKESPFWGLFPQNMVASRIQIADIEYLSTPPPSECHNWGKMDLFIYFLYCTTAIPGPVYSL